MKEPKGQFNIPGHKVTLHVSSPIMSQKYYCYVCECGFIGQTFRSKLEAKEHINRDHLSKVGNAIIEAIIEGGGE